MSTLKFPLPEGTPPILPLKKCLKLVIGGRHIDERERIFRAFWNDSASDWSNRPAFAPNWYKGTLDGSNALKIFRKTGVTLAVLFDWNQLIPEWRKKNRSTQNSKNAIKRWSKKSIDRPRNRKK